MTEFRAHGKLFVAGEYAVVEPGQPSVLIALDRAITARVTEGHGAGSVHSAEYGNLPLTWTRAEDGLALDREHHPYDYVMETIDVVEKLRGELGIEPRFHDLRISSQLDDASGRKFGLGSSAAVTVATVGALDRFYGLGLTQRRRFMLALLATIRVNPRASGGDLAASTFGGWLRYSAPDREVLAEALATRPVSEVLDDADAWAGFDVEHLPAPTDLRLLVGWTGSPASTTKLVGVVRRHRDGGYASFLDDSRACVDDLTTGLRTGNAERTLGALRRARGLMQRLGDSVGSRIETDRLTTLCDVVESAGGAAKPSGAGGGDCGIALVPADGDIPSILREWEAHDIRHLTIAVQPRKAPSMSAPEQRTSTDKTITQTPIPTRWVGPIRVSGNAVEGEHEVPLATYESPLWPSVGRGARISRMVEGGIVATVVDERMTRSVVVRATSAAAAHMATGRILARQAELEQIVVGQSRFAKLVEVHPEIVGDLLFLRFAFTTGDASGHNMVTQAADTLLPAILAWEPELSYVSISGNFCSDKKATAVNGIRGRGRHTIAEIVLPGAVVERFLKSSTERIVDLNTAKNLVGSTIAGALRSANAHYANMLLGFYLATGQDAANIVEGSQGITFAEARGDDLYFSCSLPHLIVGTVGNGKGNDLPVVEDALVRLGCREDREPGANARRLAGLCAATVLCGELSLLAAQTNPGS